MATIIHTIAGRSGLRPRAGGPFVAIHAAFTKGAA
jgi:hypothetical protein